MADWDVIKEEVVQAKDVDLTYSVTDNGVAFDLTGKSLRMIVSNMAGTTVKTWLSTGASPVITIATSTVNILDTAGFTDWGFYRGELINDTDDDTLAFFEFEVVKQITAPTA